MEKRSSGLSTLGLISGIAGLLTAIAALVGLLAQFGVIGGKDSGTKGTGVSAGQEVTGNDSNRTTKASPRFSVDRQELLFNIVNTSGKVKVTNSGQTPLSVQPTIQGSGAFAVKDETCTRRQVGADDSCEVEVTFTPGAAEARGRLVIDVEGAPEKVVSLTGKVV